MSIFKQSRLGPTQLGERVARSLAGVLVHGEKLFGVDRPFE
ncbi:hypothetical protein [Paraburkholderia caledonica]|nr:hypothetical protein [Paraburkholderia caledonica]